MKCKGQVALEFMMLLIIMLLYVQLIIIPNIEISAAAVEDTARLGEARFAAEKVVNAVNYMAITSGESKQTVSIFVPENAKLICTSDKDLNIEVTLNPFLSAWEPVKCKNDGKDNVCVKSFSFPVGFTVNCVPADFSIEGPVLQQLTISKSLGEVYIET